MDFGYAIQILREKVADDSYELTLSVEQKDVEIQDRQKRRLAILQDAMNALGKLSSAPQANELSPHISGSSTCPFCGGSKTTPFVRHGKSQDCTECDDNGKIKNRKLVEYELDDMIENYRDANKYH